MICIEYLVTKINEEEIMSEVQSIKPLGDRVVIEPKAQEEKTQGGIFIPTKSDEKVTHGHVVAVGPGKVVDGKSTAVALKVGQRVVYNQYSVTEVEHAGQKFAVVREDDVIAVIEE